MKTHAIIPIFIPHAGCPHSCVFCDQKAITARLVLPSVEDAERTIRDYLKTIKTKPSIETVEIAFYGGSFTALSLEEQTAYLRMADKYKKSGEIDFIHLSTRPDYIDDRILENLAAYGTDIIELGVQSFDEEVLRKSARGHDASTVFRSAQLIRQYGFRLGIQLMTGLPGDTYEKCMFSVEQTILAAPEIARIYPTIILKDTALYEMYREGRYQPPDLQDTVTVVKDMYRKLTSAGIQVIRIGLKSTDLIRNEDGAVVGGYHPAFRQVVESVIAREDLEAQLDSQEPGAKYCFRANKESFSNLTGHKKINRRYFAEKYPWLQIRYETDDSLSPSVYIADRLS